LTWPLWTCGSSLTRRSSSCNPPTRWARGGPRPAGPSGPMPYSSLMPTHPLPPGRTSSTSSPSPRQTVRSSLQGTSASLPGIAKRGRGPPPAARFPPPPGRCCHSCQIGWGLRSTARRTEAGRSRPGPQCSPPGGGGPPGAGRGRSPGRWRWGPGSGTGPPQHHTTPSAWQGAPPGCCTVRWGPSPGGGTCQECPRPTQDAVRVLQPHPRPPRVEGLGGRAGPVAERQRAGADAAGGSERSSQGPGGQRRGAAPSRARCPGATMPRGPFLPRPASPAAAGWPAGPGGLRRRRPGAAPGSGRSRCRAYFGPSSIPAGSRKEPAPARGPSRTIPTGGTAPAQRDERGCVRYLGGRPPRPRTPLGAVAPARPLDPEGRRGRITSPYFGPVGQHSVFPRCAIQPVFACASAGGRSAGRPHHCHLQDGNRLPFNARTIPDEADPPQVPQHLEHGRRIDMSGK
jgi:hypothetical protein